MRQSNDPSRAIGGLHMSEKNEFRVTIGPDPDSDPDLQLLVKYLETHDAACPVCEYNLRLLTVDPCPECGTRFRLTVGATDVFVLYWVLTVLALGLPAGVGVLVGVGIILHGAEGVRSSDWPFLLGTLVYGMGALFLAVWLVVARERFWWLRKNVQRNLAGLAFLADALALFILIVTAK
jgi:hypothetical protein